MNGHFSSRVFGDTGGGGSLWDAMEHLRSGFEQRVAGSRMARGDVRAAVLALLAERPMHGYQIIREIERRSGGAWKPSPGSIYPTLQLLSDEGLISAEEMSGRKTYTLTDEGREEAEGAERAPWEAPAAKERPASGRLPKAGYDLAQAAAQVHRTGTDEQVDAAVEVLADARRRLYAILAEG